MTDQTTGVSPALASASEGGRKDELEALRALLRERPLGRPNPEPAEAAWQEIDRLFEQRGLPRPPTRLRDELVGSLVWARYGEKLHQAIIALLEGMGNHGFSSQARSSAAAPGLHPAVLNEPSAGWTASRGSKRDHDWYVFSPDGQIAIVGPYGDHERNAHLFAAAPELCAALAAVFEGGPVEVAFSGNPIAIDRLIEQCRAALSKASTGGPK
jgi:hypothetical protein